MKKNNLNLRKQERQDASSLKKSKKKIILISFVLVLLILISTFSFFFFKSKNIAVYVYDYSITTLEYEAKMIELVSKPGTIYSGLDLFKLTSLDAKNLYLFQVLSRDALFQLVGEKIEFLEGKKDGLSITTEELQKRFEEYKKERKEEFEGKNFIEIYFTNKKIKNILFEQAVRSAYESKIKERVVLTEEDLKEYYKEWGWHFKDDKGNILPYETIKEELLKEARLYKEINIIKENMKKLVEENKDNIVLDTFYKTFMRGAYNFFGLQIPYNLQPLNL